MANVGGLRKMYDYAALLALLHVAAGIAILAYAASTGGLSVPKLRAVIAALRDEPPMKPENAQSPATESPKSETVAITKPVQEADPGAMQTDLDIIRLEAERIKTELDQRLALNNSILLKVSSEREAFQREQRAAAESLKSGKPDDRGKGFAKQVAIFDSLAPKVSVDHLLSMGDPDDAARILIALEPRKAKGIIEAAKRDDQARKMKEILQRVRAVAPAEYSGVGATAEGSR